MTEPQAPQSKPDIEDVVERANAGLAEAEAAGRAATESKAPSPAQASAPHGDNPQDAAAPDAAGQDAGPGESAGSSAAHDASHSSDAPDDRSAPASDSAVEPAAAPAASDGPARTHDDAHQWSEAGASDQATAAAEPAAPEPATPEPAAPEPAAPEPAASDDVAAAEPSAGFAPVSEAAPDAQLADAQPAEAPAETTAPADDAETRAIPDAAATAVLAGGAGAAAAASAPAAAPAEPIGLTAIAGPRPVYVAAPEPPTPRGNRGAAGLIGLVAAIAFAVLYLAAWALIDLARGTFTMSALGSRVLDQLSTADLWTPTVVFFLGFWLLGVFINRARWGYWVVFGILVGVAAYIGHIAGQLAHAQAWNLTYAASEKLVTVQLFAPLSIAAFIIGRELTIWFGAWVSARGRKITALNLAAQEEYERSLDAGPEAAAERG